MLVPFEIENLYERSLKTGQYIYIYLNYFKTDNRSVVTLTLWCVLNYYLMYAVRTEYL